MSKRPLEKRVPKVKLPIPLLQTHFTHLPILVRSRPPYQLLGTKGLGIVLDQENGCASNDWGSWQWGGEKHPDLWHLPISVL